MSENKTEAKRKRRSSEEVAAEKAAKAAAKSANAAAAANQGGDGDAPAQAITPANKVASTAAGTSQRNRLILQNTSRNIQIIPLDGDRRRRLLPNESWDVADEDLEAVRAFLKTPYFNSLVDLGHYTVRDVKPARLGEQELVAPETPEVPEELTKTPEAVTQAEFIKKDED